MENAFHKVVSVASVLLFCSAFIFSTVTVPKTYIGTVTDAMCGVKHVVGGSVACTRLCVQHGSKYALVVGDKAYMLDTKDKAVLQKLGAFAAKTALIKGVMENNMIEVSSVTGAK